MQLAGYQARGKGMVGWTATGLAWTAQCSLTFQDQRHSTGKRPPQDQRSRAVYVRLELPPAGLDSDGASLAVGARCRARRGSLSQAWSFPTFWSGCGGWPGSGYGSGSGSGSGVTPDPVRPGCPGLLLTGKVSCLRPVGRSVRSSAVAGGGRGGVDDAKEM
jgi:hypothetical protein